MIVLVFVVVVIVAVVLLEARSRLAYKPGPGYKPGVKATFTAISRGLLFEVLR